MFGLQTVAPGLTRIVLPPPAGVPQPWGTPYNVWVIDGPVPVVVDTGWFGARDALLQALAEAGVDRFRVGRVLLTGLGPAQAGNAGVFPNAGVFALDGQGVGPRWPAWVREQAAHERAFVAAIHTWGEAPGSWSPDAVAAFERAWGATDGQPLRVQPVADGAEIRAGERTFVLYATPGIQAGGATWLSSDGWMFGGELLDSQVEPMVVEAAAMIDALMRVSQTRPTLLLPAHGDVMRSHVRAFRSLNLFANNLMSNIQFALDGPRTIAEIRSRDIGYVPRDGVRFAGSCRTLWSVLEELHRVGVATREGEGPMARYHIARPSRI